MSGLVLEGMNARGTVTVRSGNNGSAKVRKLGLKKSDAEEVIQKYRRAKKKLLKSR